MRIKRDDFSFSLHPHGSSRPKTDDFSRGEARPAPRRRIGRPAVVAFPADAIAELGRRVIGVDDVARLAGVCLGGHERWATRASRRRRVVRVRRARVGVAVVVASAHVRAVRVRVRRLLSVRESVRLIVRRRGLRELQKRHSFNSLHCGDSGRERATYGWGRGDRGAA